MAKRRSAPFVVWEEIYHNIMWCTKKVSRFSLFFFPFLRLFPEQSYGIMSNTDELE